MPFKPGQSGNPGGRSKKLAEWRKSDEAQELRDLSYKALRECLEDVDAAWRDKITAAGVLLDRTEGKCIQAVSGPDDGPIQVQAITLAETLASLAAK